MAGFDLSEGEYDDRSITDDEIWSAFSAIFSSRSRNDSSYKFGFLKAILDNLYNVDSELRINFDMLFAKFAEIYWNLILKYNIRQKAKTNDGRITYLEQILTSTVVKNDIADGVSYENIPDEIKIAVMHNVKIKCKKYVVGALYEDTNRVFYSFSRKEEWIKINPIVYQFVCKHKVLIEKINYYEWARFLEKVNEDTDVSHLLSKLDESSKRTDLSVCRQILFEEFENKTCFYCGKKLAEEKIEVDHFIPWAFIKDDKLWNLVLSCSPCNRRKSNRLPEEKYLDYLVNRNESIIIERTSAFTNYEPDKLRHIYYWARVNGYDKIWNPVGKSNE